MKTVKFEPKQKEEIIWTCPCGEQLFYVHINGNMECYNCGLKSLPPDEEE
jgi:hypothetical protein